LIRRALEPEHVRQHGFEEMPRLAHKIDRIIEQDPDLAVEIYRTAFGYDEESTEDNPLRGSVLLGLISNRRQDYRHGWWTLAEKFPAFLNSRPIHATQALIGALQGYAAREHGLDREHAKTALLKVAGMTARVREDHSYVWAPRDLEPHDDAERILVAFSKYLHALANEVNAEGVFREILAIVAAENELAVIWAALIHAAADAPQSFAALLVEVVSAASVLTWSDTHYASARYLENAYPTLSDTHRVAIERAILGLPYASERESDTRLTLAGHLPAESVVTTEARELRREAEEAGAVKESRPLLRHAPWEGSVPSLSERLERNGVDIRAPSNQQIISLMEPMRPFSLEPNKFDEATFRSSLPALRALHNSTLEARATRDILDEALNYLAAAAANAARVKTITEDDEIAEFLRTVLVLAARGRDPVFNPKVEMQFARSPSWSGPSARIEAAQGLMDFLCWRRQEFDSLKMMIDELARDCVAAVRFQIVKRLLYLHQDRPEWVRAHTRYYAFEDTNATLVHEALITAHRIRASDLEETFELATAVFERFKNPAHQGEESCREDAAKIIADLHVWHCYGNASIWIGRVLDAQCTPPSTSRDLISHYRKIVVYGAADQHDSQAEPIRGRALQLYRRVADRYSSASQELWQTLQSQPVEHHDEAELESLRESFRTLDEIAMQLYFASGAYDARSTPERRPGPVQQRLFTEAHDIFDTLSNVPIPHTSHHLIETLEFFIEFDPAEVFRLIARAIRSSEAQGYTADPMAVDLFARVIERYLADFREVFDVGDRRVELLACLDAFVRHGSPKARRLTYRISDIWE
jgi:hypothetical protein